jgi:hypothetical protein
MKRFPITKLAKSKARKALILRKQLPKSKKFGIDKKEASKLKIYSGVERAKQLVRSKTIPLEDAKKVARFYSRFKNCKTPKCVGALDLWGGKEYGKYLYKKIYKNEN